jgi:hypothetical protein
MTDIVRSRPANLQSETRPANVQNYRGPRPPAASVVTETVLLLVSDFAVRDASDAQDLQYKGTTGTLTP